MRFLITLAQALGLTTLLIVLPLSGRWNLLVNPRVLLVIAGGIFLYVMKPPASPKEMVRPSFSDQKSGLFIYVAGILMFLVPVGDLRFHPERFLGAPAWSLFSGLSVLAAGSLLRFWSIRMLGSAFTSMVQTADDQHLIQSGPYRFIRHPSYLGALMMAVGISILLQSVVGLLVVLATMVPAYAFRIHVEEIALKAHFGDTYKNYQSHTKRLFPFIY
ncbi:MAG: isoprenylcysteine carboxylmethyltransferase family protein [Pseudomonadota bacterium]